MNCILKRISSKVSRCWQVLRTVLCLLNSVERPWISRGRRHWVQELLLKVPSVTQSSTGEARAGDTAQGLCPGEWIQCHPATIPHSNYIWDTWKVTSWVDKQHGKWKWRLLGGLLLFVLALSGAEEKSMTSSWDSVAGGARIHIICVDKWKMQCNTVLV